MARAQNSAQGLFAKDRIDIGANQLTYNSTAVLMSGGIRLSGQANAVVTGNSTGIVIVGGAKFSNKANATVTGDSTGIVIVGGAKISNKANAVVTGDSTGIVIVGGAKISNKRVITANSTGFIVTAESAIPTTDEGVCFTMGTDSTGVWMAINATGTTWKYLRATSIRADAS